MPSEAHFHQTTSGELLQKKSKYRMFQGSKLINHLLVHIVNRALQESSEKEMAGRKNVMHKTMGIGKLPL